MWTIEMSSEFGVWGLELRNRIFSDDLNFEKTALDVFRFQAEFSPVYKNFIAQLSIQPNNVKSIEQIPFLPIQLFKSQIVVCNPKHQSTKDLAGFSKELSTHNSKLQTVFESSGTTGTTTSKHFVVDTELYKKSFLNGFKKFYGAPSDYCILALLPSYLERNNSSLVFMADELIKQSKHPLSGFYLNEFEKLNETIYQLISEKEKFILLGVTFALLDYAEEKSPLGEFRGIGIVMETGGMKGRREEIIRSEVHNILKQKLGVEHIHSEYGMTELLSQAYSKGSGIFETPPWMKVLIRDTNDPFRILGSGKSGGINVIDFANIYSCSFIATQDLGKTFSNGSFEVLGRFDNSDLRGCNLMVG
ncbi:MAG TPA: acyl transferase [Bacteroidia bacterium]|nr:acyl transferase [Bacteroidia bacterium]HNU32575.1 acyl transferase [Bacteroidia bacterium]